VRWSPKVFNRYRPRVISLRRWPQWIFVGSLPNRQKLNRESSTRMKSTAAAHVMIAYADYNLCPPINGPFCPARRSPRVSGYGVQTCAFLPRFAGTANSCAALIRTKIAHFWIGHQIVFILNSRMCTNLFRGVVFLLQTFSYQPRLGEPTSRRAEWIIFLLNCLGF